MIRWQAAGAAALACLALAGCETTQEKSAKLEEAAKRRAVATNASGLKIAKTSTSIRAVDATALHSSEGTAVAVELANSSSAAVDVPLLISVDEGSTANAYSNSAPGLAHSLISLSYVPAHSHAFWVDDQVQLAGAPGKVSATVGAAPGFKGSAPAVAITSQKLEEEAGGVEVVAGTVENRSTIDQRELVVYAVARRGSKIVAAGRSVLASLPAGATGRFQIFLIGASAKGARLTLSAPPSTFE